MTLGAGPSGIRHLVAVANLSIRSRVSVAGWAVLPV
jgi:hypothetical protein